MGAYQVNRDAGCALSVRDVAAPVAATVSQLIHVVINVKDSVTVSF